MSGARSRRARPRPVKDPGLLERAVAAHGAGRLDEAERAYNKFLKRNPGQPVALHNLGLLAHGRGRLDDAVKLLERAAGTGEGDAGLYSNLGNMLREQGRLDAAVSALRAAVVRDPAHLNARYNLGAVLQDTGAFDEAIACYRALLERTPRDAGVLNNLGSALLASGDARGAIEPLRHAIAAAPRHARAHLNLAAALERTGDAEGAERSLHQAVEAEPALVDARAELAAFELASERLDAALEHAAAAVRLDPGRAASHLLLARVQRERGDAAAAVEALEQCVAADGESVEAWCELGAAFAARGRISESVAAVERARALEPDSARVRYMTGLTSMITGDVEGAREALEAAARDMPDSPGLWFNLSKTRRFTAADDATVTHVASIPERRPLAGEPLAQLHFALGKMHDDRKETRQSFEHYARGNEAVRARIAFDPEHIPRTAERSQEVFTRAFFGRAAGLGDDSERPVFIFGMPRSGTTLVEQILASHPSVHGAGELTLFSELAESIGDLTGSALAYPEVVETLDESAAQAIRGRYLDRLRECSPDALRVTDKLPGNFRYLGLIAALFPRARLIHCRRDPMDVCWSCFTQRFADDLHYTYSLSDLGRTYRAYERLMAHWRRVLPVPMYEVQYEILTDETERLSRELVEFCGLDWDERCLRFYETARAVNTASNWQVRQPVYRSAVARWKPYEPWLGELKAVLGEAQQP